MEIIAPPPTHLSLAGGQTLSLARPVIVGILNVTPDSFSDGGQYLDEAGAVAHGRDMIAQGADVLDIGGESTRPGSEAVSPAEQIRRVIGVIRQFRGLAPISIDTRSPEVAAAALVAGAGMINDVSAGREEGAAGEQEESRPGMFELAARSGAALVLMHMLGQPRTMQREPKYRDVVAEVKAFLLERAAAAEAAGVGRGQIVLDPGIGFGKTLEHNLALLARLDELVATGYAVMLGASRKAFLGQVAGRGFSPGAGGAERLPAGAGVAATERTPSPLPPAERVAGTCATTALGVGAGVQLFRVHDVRANRQAADVAFAVCGRR